MTAGPRATDRRRLLLLLLLVGAVTLFTATVPLLRDWFDLRVYHGAVHAWTHQGGRLYDYRVPGTAYGFTYPPFAAVAMLPLALVGLGTAVVLCLLLNLLASAAVLYVLFGPLLRRYGRFGAGLAVCLLALFEPVRDTVSFGQVNLLLLAVVLGDAWLLSTGREKRAGVGIGLAAAVKLTPALFIGLLLIAGRWRAAGRATAVAAAATAAAAWIAPDASRFYWTEALWDTGRIGRLDYVSNQSLQGVLARLGEPDRAVWAVTVLCVLGVWAWQARRGARAGDWTGAFAVTGLASCLVSPITWVHHLVWVLPSFAVLLRHRRLVGVAACAYALLCTSVVWLWVDAPHTAAGFLGGNTYVWITLGLLLGLPVGQPRPEWPPFSRSNRSTSATAPAPTTAAPAMAAAADQPGPVSPPFTTVTPAGPASGSAPVPAPAPAPAPGSEPGPVGGRERGGSTEPTGSTRPAARKPQSSSERASS
ncbi:glycosyltransferase 87 family protein [Streptomyces poonensis]|uniref:glycosyltransferase 87 family protein n=1 Tax=Streptomyces poonensis TaxID=68255 RepID=UPI0027E3E1EA|nr:glycosyltransferase 87 family protein [Streptomyces poonensis]